MSRVRLHILPLGVVALALAASPAAAQRGDQSGYASRIDTTFAFSRGGVVDAEQVAGDVIVTTWERSEVRVRAYAQHGRVRTQFSRDRVWLRVDGDDSDGDGQRSRRGRSGRIGDSRYEITVPAGTRVKLGSVSGNVRVEGTRAEVEASSVSGNVGVTDAVGLTSVTSVSGDVSVSRVNGDLALTSVSGDVLARAIEGDIRASSVSGDIELRDVRSRSVVAKTTSGDIDFAGGVTRGGRYEFHAHSGDVTLTVPADVGAEVSMSTFSGSLESDFPVTLGGTGTRRRTSRDMSFTLNDGGARVTIETFSGDVRIERAGRGRVERE